MDLPGQALLILTLAAVTFATIEGPVRGWSSAPIAGGCALAACALAAFLTVEHHRDEPLLELRFFRSAPFAGAATIATLAFAILAGFLFLNTLYLQEVRGESALMAGVATLPATVVIAVISPPAGRFVARHGSRFLMTTAGLFLAAGAIVLSLDRVDSPYLYLASGYVLLGLGSGLINPPITNTAVAGMPKAQAGVASAVATSSRQLGNVLGVAIIGSMAAGSMTAGTMAAGPVGRAAFTVASHRGWDIAAGCGIAIAVLAYLTTGARARAAAEEVSFPDGPSRRPADGALGVGQGGG